MLSLWAVQKTALMVLLAAVLGPIPLASLLDQRRTLRQRLAYPPRKRKPHIQYPVQTLS